MEKEYKGKSGGGGEGVLLLSWKSMDGYGNLAFNKIIEVTPRTSTCSCHGGTTVRHNTDRNGSHQLANVSRSRMNEALIRPY